ncbi:hypothetical protein [Paenibacillus elgii]|uniref:hypothetical protein n=1 Tax=Paenibacillus elgii TaxID=189691 RepID=UPI00203D4E8A|nr:hypothetical protein [Paenibacillus elgii]MCM3274202.1 hypothetical protein [Paenibacillus elgii]
MEEKWIGDKYITSGSYYETSCPELEDPLMQKDYINLIVVLEKVIIFQMKMLLKILKNCLRTSKMMACMNTYIIWSFRNLVLSNSSLGLGI